MSVKSIFIVVLLVAASGAGGFFLGQHSSRSGLHTSASSAGLATRSVAQGDASEKKAADAAHPELEKKSESKRLAELAARPATSFAAEEERQHRIEEWAAVDPLAAMDFVRSQLKGDRQAQAMAAVISIWGKADPAAAWSWVSQEMPTATHHFDTLLEVFGRSSPELAGRYAASYSMAHPEAALEVHLAALLGVTYKGDFAAARSLVEMNGSLDPVIRGNLNNFIAGQWGRFAPDEAAAWVMTLPPGVQRDQALIGLGESWSEVNPPRAADFAAQLPPGETRTLAMRQAISKWVEADPDAARNWVLKNDRHEDFDQAVEAIATQNNMMSREPQRALRWASGIFDDGLRVKSVSTILFNWYPADPAAATAYLQTSPDFTPEQRADLLRKLQATK